MTKKDCSLLFMLIVSLFYFPMLIHAEDTGANFTVQTKLPDAQIEGSKNYFDVNLSPKDETDLSIVIKNNIEKQITVNISAHTAFTNSNGVVEYAKDAPKKDPTLTYSINELLDYPKQIVLKPNETKQVDVRLTMPDESFEGLLAGGIVLQENEENESKKDTGLSVTNQYAYVVGVVASNERDQIEPSLDLLDVHPDQINYRNVFSAVIQNRTPVFVNQLEVEAKIYKSDQKDAVFSTKKTEMQVAPNSQLDFPIPLNGKKFESGRYKAVITAKSGEYEWNWEKKFSIKDKSIKEFNQTDVTIEQPNHTMWVLLIIFLLMLLIILTLAVKLRSGKRMR
jgi:hypothetical protein